jgi:DNA-binding transcriptional LysR family regulator
VVDDRLAEHGLTREVLATVPSAATACLLACESDALALVPAEFARRAAEVMPLTALRIPLELPPVRVGMAWHLRVDTAPVHRWLRDTMRGIVAETVDSGFGRERASW